MRVLQPDREPSPPLPRGRHAASARVVADSQRTRLLDAMTEQVAARGLGAVRLADVAKGAGVSLSTFYEHFAGKTECFLAAYDAVATALIAEIEAVEGDEAEQLVGGLEAYLRWFAARPAAARAYLVEVHAAGEDGLHARTAVLGRFHASAVAAAPDIDAGALRAFLLLVDALAHEEVLAGRTDRLPDLQEGLVTLAARLLSPTP